MSDDKLTATAAPVSVGRRLQVWQTRIETEAGKLVPAAPLVPDEFARSLI